MNRFFPKVSELSLRAINASLKKMFDQITERIVVDPNYAQGPRGDRGPAGPTGATGPSGASGVDQTVILAAESCPVTNRTFSAGLPATTTYTDTAEFTSNSKTYTFAAGLPTQTVHTFTYNAQVWTVTYTYTFENGLPKTGPYVVAKL